MSDFWIREEDGTLRRVDGRAWASWFEHADRTLAVDRVGDARISTVFLGLDHSFGIGPPLVFETMVFGGPQDGAQWRYSTEAEARRWHDWIVGAVRQGVDLTAINEPPVL